MRAIETGHEMNDALQNQFGLADRVVDEAVLANSVRRFRERGIVMPTIAQLANPAPIPPEVVAVHQRDLSKVQIPGGAGRADFDAMVRRVDKIDTSWRE